MSTLKRKKLELNVGDGLLARKVPIAAERTAIDNEIWDDVLKYFEGVVFVSGVGWLFYLGKAV